MIIAGLLLRNFKIYKNVNFIPFLYNEKENYLNIFIGNNGSGKSSILEALNAFFNEGKWIATTSATAKEVYVVPVLLLEKTQYEKKLKESDLTNFVESLSEFFWKVPNASGAQEFTEFRETIREKYEKTHHLLLLGYCFAQPKNLFFGPYERKAKEEALKLEWNEEKGELQSKTYQNSINKQLQKILEFISFIYIPAETNIPDFLKLESEGMQDLVNRTIKEEIEAILNSEFGASESKKNIIDLINDQLKPYVEKIQDTIQAIDPEYKFNEGTRSSKLNAKDLIGKIIMVYYSKRKLEKNKKPIENLSSGERKKALIDIIYSFLSQDGKQEKAVVFAIDEPEASLDSSKRYDAFDRVEKIANKNAHQTFITTHWYGLLPIINNGMIHCLSQKPGEENKTEIKNYDAKNFIASRRKDPDDDYFKSFNDLSTSIVSSLRNTTLNWIIVEGPDDKRYLEYYLSKMVANFHDNYRILSVGGSGNVKLLYEHLFIPIDKSKKGKLHGKVFCLVDTDEVAIKTRFPSQTDNEKLVIRKLIHKDDEISLFGIDHVNTNESEMEDALEGKKFFDAIVGAFEKYGTPEEKIAMKNFEYDTTTKHSKVKGDNSILIYKPTTEGSNQKADKETMNTFIEANKVRISISYTELPFQQETVPPWINEHLLGFFSSV